MTKWMIKGAAIVALFAFAWLQQRTITSLRQERARYQQNTESLLSAVNHYKTRDSLNAAKVGTLSLSIAEYKRYRAKDAQLIKTLQTRNRDLQAVTAAQTQTIMELSATVRDTVIIRDSVQIQAMAVHVGDAWYDFDGMIEGKQFAGSLVVRDSIVIAETVKYKRFLGFLWKTKKVKSRQIDCVSKNPHVVINGIEHIKIEK